MDPGIAMMISSAIAGGSELAGGLLGGKEAERKPLSTFSSGQESVNRYLLDFILGIQRNAQGQEVSRRPILQEAFNRRTPQRRIAPLTGNQQDGLKMAEKLLAKIKNSPRPDSEYMGKLARGILPGDSNPRYAALGANLKPGERAVVGEDGTEVIQANADGTVTVIPNPKSVSSPRNIAKAMLKSNKEKLKYNASQGYATGSDPRRYWEYDDPTSGKKKTAYFDNTYTGGRGSYWDYDQPYTAGMETNFNQYLGDTFGGSENKNPLDWYNVYQNKYGGDLSKAVWPNQKNYERYLASNLKVGTDSSDSHRRVHAGYAQAYDDWYKTLPQTYENKDLNSVMDAMPDDTRDTFGPWLRNNSSYGLTDNYKMSEGEWGFDNPFEVDIGNVTRARDDYLKSLGYVQGSLTPSPGNIPSAMDDPIHAADGIPPDRDLPDGTPPGTIPGAWTKPNDTDVGATDTPPDWTTLLGEIGDDNISAFNEFSRQNPDWGGALIDTDPEGNRGFGSYKKGVWTPSSDDIYGGTQNLVRQFGDRPDDTGAGTGTDVDDSPTGDVDADSLYNEIIEA